MAGGRHRPTGWRAGRSWRSTAAHEQRLRLAARREPDRALSTARSESAAEFLCAELTARGLPFDVDEAERIIADAIGARPRGSADASRSQRERDARVLQHVGRWALRSTCATLPMCGRCCGGSGSTCPNTRAGRLEQFRDVHPVVEALLTWRKAERIATTYGYRWLDEHVVEGRLRGAWTSSDGAAGRMTASSGLHNLPADLRSAVAAEPGCVLVRADLGQIEPRVLAAVSGDAALIAATRDDDLYQPVASRLQVTRDVAKVAVLGGDVRGDDRNVGAGVARSGAGAIPRRWRCLEQAAAAGRAGDDVYTVGGRRVRMWVDDSVEGDIERARRVAAARGRFARNALIQGAAAEFFKVWAVTVRARTASLGAEIVLCLHDELLVQCREEVGDDVLHAVEGALAEAAARWSPHREVRFVADLSVVSRWSDAK